MNAFFLVLALIAFFVVQDYLSLLGHETTHQKTFSYAGINSTIEYGLFSAETVRDKNQFGDLTNLYLAQAIIEAERQNVGLFFIQNSLLFAIFLAIVYGKTKN